MSEPTKEPTEHTPMTDEEELQQYKKEEEEYNRKQKEFFDKYPKIFPVTPYNTTPQESCMYWGLETPYSWWPVLDALCETLQSAIDGVRFLSEDGCECYAQLVAEQVKEKYGELRFYYKEVPNEDPDALNRKNRSICAFADGAIEMANTVIQTLKVQYKET